VVACDSPFFKARERLWFLAQKWIVQLEETVLCPFSTAPVIPCGFRGKKVREQVKQKTVFTSILLFSSTLAACLMG